MVPLRPVLECNKVHVFKYCTKVLQSSIFVFCYSVLQLHNIVAANIVLSTTFI